ncbi:hypothetical protein D621_14955 [beta proteobacterium AAP51]|nr:hypothetical protein D621_14955 [beta proteobacterium AAP51]
MKLVFLAHPEFLGLRSQGHFVRMLAAACQARGHAVQVRQPRGRLQQAFAGTPLAKWAGYAEQYLLFAQELRRLARHDDADTLYVFCDQALGPWVPALVHRPHVVHCHDLLALRSALGELPENPTRASGRVYQRYIRRGFAQARHFISISRQTRADLHRLGQVRPLTSEVVFNGLNHAYAPLARPEALVALARAGFHLPQAGLLLHVGGGQWYKNAAGVVAMYVCLARRAQAQGQAVPQLLMVSPPGVASEPAVAAWLRQLPEGAQVLFRDGLDAGTLQALYSLARALLFPSLAEGFGWPVAEALACGCPVLTTDAGPMNEVGGDAAVYVPRLDSREALPAWAERAAGTLALLLAEPPRQAAQRRQRALAHAALFDSGRAIDAYLRIYEKVLQQEQGAAPAGRGLASTRPRLEAGDAL